MDQHLLFENERFIRCILRGSNNYGGDIRCSIAKSMLRQEFVRMARELLDLNRLGAHTAYERALARVLIDYRLQKVSLTETRLESLLRDYGVDEMMELKMDELRAQSSTEPYGPVDYVKRASEKRSAMFAKGQG